MPDKHAHITSAATAELIRQYLAGELDDKAMHALELQALNDPFLADALDGFSEHAPDQSVHIADLQSRLADRVQQARPQKKGRVLGLYYRWAAAAAILVLIGISSVWIWQQQIPRHAEIVKVEEQTQLIPKTTPVPPADTVVAPAADMAAPAPAVVTTQNVKKPQDKAASPAISAPVTYSAAPPAQPPQLKRQAAPQADKEERSVNAAAPLGMVADSHRQRSFAVKDTDKEALYQVKQDYLKDSVTVTAYNIQRKSAITASKTVIAPATIIGNKKMLQGRVVDQTRGDALPGVAINIKGSDRATVTDGNGNFVIPVDSNKTFDLAISGLGYESQKINAAKAGDNLRISMKEDNRALSEVVVTGKAAGVSTEPEEPATYVAAAPENGMASFRRYIAAHLVLPESVTTGKVSGTVRVAFKVMPDGTLQDFRILRGINEDCDAAAIRVIKDGPRWKPASDGQPDNVKLKIQFKAPKQ